MIIVAGKLKIKKGERQAFLKTSLAAIIQARATPGCLDFVVSADPLEDDRVNIYEEWETQGQLDQFRGDGPGDELGNLIVDASVSQREFS